MSEKLKPIDAGGEQYQKELRFPEDPNQYSEEELMLDPAKRFHVNPDDFPIFSQQALKGERFGDDAKTLPLDETMSRHVKATADCIAVIAGEDTEGGKGREKIPAADFVIYLDKSARPVSWLNNAFWDAFTDKPRPKHSYLAIDRMEWFRRTETLVNMNGEIEDSDGTMRLARASDLRMENVTDMDIARIRALFIPGGIKNEDIEEIMNTPTNLEGKNITIIDEVERSGSTLGIAEYLVSRAIPEAASINGYYYWAPGWQISEEGQKQMRGTPVWYDTDSILGRGIGDINEAFFAKRYELYPTPKTRAQKFGAIVLGSFIDLSEEYGNKSRELANEIMIMRREWDDGHIMMEHPDHYDEEKWMDRLESQGVMFMPQQANMPRNAYLKIRNDISKRPAI